jgi:hypothetical protein
MQKQRSSRDVILFIFIIIFIPTVLLSLLSGGRMSDVDWG